MEGELEGSAPEEEQLRHWDMLGCLAGKQLSRKGLVGTQLNMNLES